ncbi:MAG: hypothetical protein LUG21_01365, partial [Clostridiales bacterium]|nr:hypothetical protein [Clostridiales bacterium]
SALRISKDAKFTVGASVESYNSLMDKVSAVDGSKYSNYESVLKSINDQSEIILSFDNKEFAGESQAAGEYLSVLNEIRNLIDSFQPAFTSIENGSAVSVTYGSTNGYSADNITTSLKNQILQITYFKTVSGDSSFTTEYDITVDNTYYNWAAYRGAQLHGLGFGAYGQDSTGNQSVLWKEGGAAKSDSFNDSLYNYHTALMKTPQNYTVGSDYINIIANTNGQKILGEHTVTAKASSTVASTQFTTPDIYELINVYDNEKQRINTDVKQTVTVIDIYPLIEKVNAATEIVDNSYLNLYGCYTETTWNNFITALTNAKADLAYTEMSDTEIVNECKTRLSNLTNAISKLTVNNSGTHKYTEQAGSIQPTCTSSGALILKCDICGNTVRTRPAALGHDKIYTSNGDSKTHTVSCSRGDLDETENCTGTDYCEFCGQQLYVTAEWDEFNTAKALMEQALAESESGTVKYTADALKTANENISEITYYNYTAQQQTAVRDTEQNEINTQTVLINNAVSALENGKADSSVYEANLSKIKTLNADAYDIAEIENAVKDVEITKTVAVNGKNYIGWIYDNYNVAFGTALTENQYEYTVSVTDADGKIWCLDTAQRLIEVAAGVNEKGETTFTPVNSGDTVGTFHYGDYISVPNPANASEVCNWSESVIAHSTNTNSSKKYIASSAKYQFNLRGNTSLYIDSASDGSLSKVITFVDSSSGKVIGTEYTASSEYVINTENLPTVPFYKIEGYKRSDTGETFTSAQIGNIESDITIYVTYAPAASVPLYTITLVNENNEIIDVQIKEFNKLVTLSAPGAAAYVYSANNSDKVLWYGNEYSFYACRDIIVKAVSNAPDSAEADVISAPLVTKGGSVTEFSFIGSFAVPDDCTVQSYGIVLDLNGSIGNLTLYDVDSAKGVYNLSASKHTIGNQFTVNVTLAMDYNPSVNYVSYVVYTDKNGNTQYAYSNVVTGAELPVA